MDANTRANVAAQAEMGGTLRGVDDARARAPIDLLTAQLGLFGNLPLELFRGETTNSETNSTGSQTRRGTNWGLSVDFEKLLA